VTGPPDFVGVGVPRAGTTWWYSLLVRHPQIAELEKERYFLTRFMNELPTASDAEEYERLFPRQPGLQAGEWSPGYLHNFWVPAALRAVAPSTRVLALLRDPVGRYHSGVTKVSGRRSRPAADAGRAFAQGCYASQLERLFASFPREQVLVLQYEQCVADPALQLRRTFAFLGVDPDFRPDGLDRVVNRTEAKAPLDAGLEHALVDGYAAELDRLERLVPDLDLDLWSRALPGRRNP
jgi:hypothetical protein